jgi:hypothetical protein
VGRVLVLQGIITTDALMVAPGLFEGWLGSLEAVGLTGSSGLDGWQNMGLNIVICD